MKERGNILLLVAVVGILVSGIAGYFYWFFAIKPSVSKPKTEEQTKTPETSKNPKEIDTKNWKEYINKQLNFSFRYPDVWSVDSSSNSVQLYSSKGLCDYECAYQYNIQIKVLDVGVEKYFTDNITTQKTGAIYYIGAYTAQEVYINEMATSYGLIIDHQKTYEISFPFISDRTKIGSVERQILSTFKFLDQNSTYTCPETKYVDCMPGPTVSNQCNKDYISWAEGNCPGFKGATY